MFHRFNLVAQIFVFCHDRFLHGIDEKLWSGRKRERDICPFNPMSKKKNKIKSFIEKTKKKRD